jgi:CheY-like chemotaxis protein/HPt (histidine-containing phosphotransfer) domain-containing protein
VAEDSPDNRLLVEAYLKGSAHTLVFADDGRSAVDLFARGRFDLVLMDMQMPVMDGLEATRAIRALEQKEGRPPTPVVALTANARPEDIAASRLAGCDAHLSKPISRRQLLAALEATGAVELEPRDSQPFTVEVPAGLEAIVPGYLDARRHDVRQAAELLANGDLKRLQTLGHNMAGTGQSFGFDRLSELGQSLEGSARDGDAVAAARHITAIREYLDRARLALRATPE